MQIILTLGKTKTSKRNQNNKLMIYFYLNNMDIIQKTKDITKWVRFINLKGLMKINGIKMMFYQLFMNINKPNLTHHTKYK